LRGPRGAILMCREQHAKALDRAVFPGLQGGPHQHQTAAIAVALGEALTPAFGEYAHRIVANAKALAVALSQRGFTLVSGGTDNHLILLDMTSKGLTGKEASTALAQSGIVTNANAIPFDPRKPFDPSGVRIGTPAVTSRGLLTEHMDEIARWLDEVVEAARGGESDTFARVKAEVNDLMEQYPAPGCRSSAAAPAALPH
jgi:glycine hydroxymethyltransferase